MTTTGEITRIALCPYSTDSNAVDSNYKERFMCPHVSLAETWDCLVSPWKQRYGSPSCQPRTLGDIRRQARETLVGYPRRPV